MALRYWAMRGELFDPGGDSLTPTSAAAIATIFWPTDPFAGTAAAPPTAPGAIAPWSIDANCDCVPDAVPPALAGAGGVVVVAIGGASAELISEMRARTV